MTLHESFPKEGKGEREGIIETTLIWVTLERGSQFWAKIFELKGFAASYSSKMWTHLHAHTVYKKKRRKEKGKKPVGSYIKQTYSQKHSAI